MISTINSKLPANWHFTRVIGLLLALIFGVQAMIYQEVFAALISAFFLIQVVTNTGCFGSQGCAVEYPKGDAHTETVECTEIETKKEQ